MGRASVAKNVVTKVYSAVALSMRTSIRDRNNASTGSFCITGLIKDVSACDEGTYMCLVLGHVQHGHTGTIYPTIR